MRKFLAFLVLLMLPWMARGQALADWYYWFDQETEPHETGSFSGQQFHIAADVSHLQRGMHTLYVQVKNNEGIYSTPHSQTFYLQPENGTKAHRFLYWFDGNATIKEQAFGSGNYLLDVSALSPGFHFINYMVMTLDGLQSEVGASGFYRIPSPAHQKLYYWLAGDNTATQVENYADGFVVDVTRVREGFNTIYFQMDDNGPTNIQSENFIKVTQTENAGDMTLVCIIDGKIAGEEKVSVHGGMVQCKMDVSKMDVGMHKAMFQLIAPSGAGSSIAETYFIRTLTNDDVASMQCSYNIDGQLHRTQKGTCTNGAFHFDLPVEELSDGLHRIDYMLVAENGASTTQGSAWFIKTPLGGNGITQYDYWLNGKTDDVQSVVLEAAADPFHLVKLLPVMAEPIRSTCFHFENKDNQPTIYAKNDIHFRFYDKSSRWLDANKQYVDYNVAEKVTDVSELLTTQTFERPDSNYVKWFKFEAETGDTIAFKASQATSLQVFAPSGKEIYSASGDKSVKYGGAHTWENGTYYVAVHDVTGSKPNVTLDFYHLGKYAVLSHTPTVQGNIVSSFKMDLFGNGFDKLKSAVLRYNDNVIEMDTIVTRDISNTSVYFSINKTIANGQYNLVLTYNDNGKEDMLTVNKALRIEEPAFGDIKVSVGHKYSNYNPVTLTISITNPGNINYTYVPFNIAWDNPDNISSIEFNNFWLSMSRELDSLGYSNVVITKNLLNKGVKGGIMYFFIPCLKAHETMDIKLDMSFRKPAVTSKVYAWCGTPLECDTATYVTPRSGMRRSYNAQTARNILSAGDVAENVTGIRGVPQSAGYAGQAANTAAKIGVTFAGIMEASDHAVDMAYLDAHGIDPNSDLGQEIAGLHGHGLLTPGEIVGGGLGNLIDGLLGLHRDCSDNPTPEPEGEGGAAHHISVDPNDIYGYISESGSKFMTEDVVNIPYRIEFENDTTFATASAHTVVVKDTLDAKVFDLASYQPTSIKIGDKEVQLKGDKEFVTTVDMRPEINAIAQVEGKYDEKKGIATWQFTSLDPMTMEPTDDIMQGILPVNYDGSGIGEVAYHINRKAGLSDGTEINNQASIIFDSNEPIETPVWTNIIDAVTPTSRITDIEMLNDTIVRLHFESDDNRSGVWKYTLYAQYGSKASWENVSESLADSSYIDFRYYRDIDYGFCVLATDSAGNIELKELQREGEFVKVLMGDINGDGSVNVGDLTSLVSFILNAPIPGSLRTAADMDRNGVINVTDYTLLVNKILNQ